MADFKERFDVDFVEEWEADTKAAEKVNGAIELSKVGQEPSVVPGTDAALEGGVDLSLRDLGQMTADKP